MHPAARRFAGRKTVSNAQYAVFKQYDELEDEFVRLSFRIQPSSPGGRMPAVGAAAKAVSIEARRKFFEIWCRKIKNAYIAEFLDAEKLLKLQTTKQMSKGGQMLRPLLYSAATTSKKRKSATNADSISWQKKATNNSTRL